MKVGHTIIVGAIFGGTTKIKPVWFIWDGRHYHIKDITYRWNRRNGRSLLHHFSVIDTSDNLYEIAYQTDNATWHLLGIAEDTSLS